MQAPSPLPMLGKYQLLRKIAAGGMAEVYLAAVAGPMGFSKKVVLKRILPHLADDQSFVGMFMSEAKLAAQLNHPNVVSIYDFGQEQDTWYIVMELIDGPNLRALYRRATQLGQPLDFGVAAKIVALACEGLAYAHDFVDPETGQPLGLVHRDISPDNILVSRAGGVKVVDFGIAKAANQTHHTKTGTVKGKFAYMPPEQLRGEPLDCRSDIFALGVVLYELLTGAKPFPTDTEAVVVQAILFGEWALLESKRPGTPAELQRIVDKALSRKRESRYQTCRELYADLERFIASTGTPVGQYEVAQVVQALDPTPQSTFATPAPQPSVLAPPPPAPPPSETEEEAVFWSVVDAVPPRVPPPVPDDATRPLAPTPAPQPFPAASQSPFPLEMSSAMRAPTQTQAGVQPGFPVSLGELERPAPPRKRPTLEVLEAPKPRSPVLMVLAGVLAVGVGVGGVLLYKKVTDTPPATTDPLPPVADVAPPPVEPRPVEQPSVEPPPVEQPSVESPPVEPPPAVVVAPPVAVKRKQPTVKKMRPPKTVVAKKAAEPVTTGLVTFRVRPYASVYLNETYLGDTPLKPAEVPTGRVTVRLVNKDLRKDVKVPFDVKVGDNVFKYNLDD